MHIPDLNDTAAVQPERRDRIFFTNLDGLRFLAFSLVFLQHGLYGAFRHFEDKGMIARLLISDFFVAGGIGVQIFFVLSGFLITYLILQEIRRTGRLDIGRFYLRRTLRIWPLYFAVVLFGFVVYPWLKSLIGMSTELCSRPWYYVTFLANFDVIHIARNCPGQDAMIQGILWSVSIEEQFYLVWPLLFLLLPAKWYRFVFPVVILLSLLFRFNQQGPELYFHTFSVMGDLAAGGALAYYCTYNDRFRTWLKDQSRGRIRLSYLLILLFYIVHGEIFKFSGGAALSRLVLDVCWVYIIGTQCFSRELPLRMGRYPLVNKMGVFSYGLYMLHPVGILVVDIIFRKLNMASEAFMPALVKGLAGLTASIVIAWLSYRFLEQPFLKLKKRFAVISSGN